jgi:hypothetical protein
MKLDTLARVHAKHARDTVTSAHVPPLDQILRRHRVSSFTAAIAWAAVVGSAALVVLFVSGPAIDNAPQTTRTVEAGVMAPLPDNTWLNFLSENCPEVESSRPPSPDSCFRDAHWMKPNSLDLGAGTWTAYRPFHVREGFITTGDAVLGEGFDVVLFITRRAGPPLAAGVYPLDETFVDPTDYVTRGATEYCGPGYSSQDGPQECQWFVHDFPDGLPPGRYDIRADWQAPCWAWVDLGFVETCTDPNEVMSLFNSFVNSAFVDDPSYDSLNEPFQVFTGLAGVEQTSEQFEPGGFGFGASDAGLVTDPATFEGEVAPSSPGATPPPGDGVPVHAETPRLPLGERTELPDNAWLDFLAGLCWETCFRDAHIVDPTDDQMGFGRWAADLPFHIREGFVNEAEAPLGDGFEVVVYVTRRAGPQLDGGAYEINQTHRFSSDYVLRATAAKCGPGYWDQTEPQTCEWFVHDFAAGLPPGRYDIWAKWYAPCSAWLALGLAGSCEDPAEVTSLFASSVNMPFYGDGFNEGVEQPFDPYLFPKPITRGATTG